MARVMLEEEDILSLWSKGVTIRIDPLCCLRHCNGSVDTLLLLICSKLVLISSLSRKDGLIIHYNTVINMNDQFLRYAPL